MAEIHRGTWIRPTKLELLTDWMGSQRWYAAKGSVPQLELLSAWRLGDPAGAVGIETLIVLDRGGPEPIVYQVPLSYRGAPLAGADAALVGTMEHGVLGPRWVYDATHDPVYARALLDLILGVASAESSSQSEALDPRYVGERAATWTEEVTVVGSRVLSGEQSNTSIILDTVDGAGAEHSLIVKVFRMLAGGDNPDVVLQSALRVAGCDRVPEVIGSVRGSWPTPAGAVGAGTADTSTGEHPAYGHLAFAQEFLPGVEDAWRVALRLARDGVSAGAGSRTLGRATAEVHRTLAAALGTTPTSAETVARIIAGMRSRYAAAAAVVPELAELAGPVAALLDAAREATWPDLQRIHGDFHLGQVLRSPDRGWILLDFEGEPLRPLAERTVPDQWLRDVAGMLRSFDYAGGSIEHDGGGSTREWVAEAQGSFLDGYAEIAANPRDYGAVLAAYEIDKAMYEVVYETRNRPDWLEIPLGAIRRLTAMEDQT